jgi:uncharacterized protein YjbI with pentapeptide repeats
MNKEHVSVVRRGAAAIARWRKKAAPPRRLDLSGSNLSGVLLTGANLTGADLTGADLSGARLTDAELARADLTGADLSGADLTTADLSDAMLADAYLSEAHLIGATLESAKLPGADLERADLTDTNLSYADLNDAHLFEANLSGADFRYVYLDGANLSHCELIQTVFIDVDLSRVVGLESIEHLGPSTLDWGTLQRSWPLPEAFLRGCGLPDQLITFLPSLLTANPIQYYPVFISYSSQDDEFARRLYNDLQGSHVRCWFAPEDLKIGARTRVGIDEAIRVHDKLLLVLSEHSVASDWVEQEVETAMERERKTGRLVLFPIRIDDAVFDQESGWAAHLRRTRNIGDFTKWKDHDAYRPAFQRVLRDLKQEITSPMPGTVR